MDAYIKGNKAAWEEAFELRAATWGTDIVERIRGGEYAFFTPPAADALRKLPLEGKTIGQFCCNNGRELLSLVKSAKAARGVGFDIAENMVRFATEKATELQLPCEFVATNILEIDDRYTDCFDMLLITLGALCWFKDLRAFFAVVGRCLKKGGLLLIDEQHPLCNMLALEDEAEYDAEHPLNCAFSYFDHEWVGNGGMYYIVGKHYASKTFTDYTHPISDIVGALCANGMVVTDMQEFDIDNSGGFSELSGKGFPLSLLIQGRKE